MTGIRKTATGHGGRKRQADGVIGCFIHRADLDYCRVRYEMILVLVQLFSFCKRHRYGTSAVAPLGLVLSLIADPHDAVHGLEGEEWYSAGPYRYDVVQR